MTPTWFKTASLASLLAGVAILGAGINVHLTPAQAATGTELALPPLDPKVLADTAPATSTQPAKQYAATDTAALVKAAEKAEAAVVTGTVDKVEVSRTGKVAKITFQGAAGKDAFNAAYLQRTFEKMDAKFGKNGTDLVGKKVRITGTLKLYRGSPEILIDDPAQVEAAK